jgi:hypothetical protein
VCVCDPSMPTGVCVCDPSMPTSVPYTQELST